MAGIYRYQGKGFSVTKSFTTHPKTEEFLLHNHTGYEILFVFKGNVLQLVEGNTYNVSKNDMIIVRNDEFHQLFPKDEEYERIVIGIDKSFFEENGIEKSVSIFEERKSGEGNLITSKETVSSGIYDCVLKIDEYIKEEAPESIINGAITEFLYRLSKINKSSSPQKRTDKLIKEIIDYISESFNSIESIDEIAEKFYISKAYLCRKFKKETGFTLNKYITNKKMLYVKERYKNGESLTKLANDAGFSSYAGFYKAYTKETGKSPKKMLEWIRN